MHSIYPHFPGRLPGCEKCDSKCHCNKKAVREGRETRCVWRGHEETDALTLAILALNTIEDGEATSKEDWIKLETHGPSAVNILMRLRGEVKRRG